jgi:hypothetical protein
MLVLYLVSSAGSLCTASKIHALGAAAGLHYLSSNSEKKAEGLANFNGSLSTPSNIHALGAAAGLCYLSSNNVRKAGASPNFNGSLSTPSKVHAPGAVAVLRYFSSNNARKAGASPNFNGKPRDGFCFKVCTSELCSACNCLNNRYHLFLTWTSNCIKFYMS